MKIQEDGTWVDWVAVDPDRIKRLMTAAANKLQVYAGIPTKFGTDSEDGESTFLLRQNVTKKKTQAGLSGWLRDADYFKDFDNDSSSEAVTLPSCVGFAALPSGSSLSDEDSNGMAVPAFSMHVCAARAPSCVFNQRFAFSLALKKCHDTYLLCEKHLNLIQRLSSCHRRPRSSISFLEEWLQRNEGGILALHNNTSIFYLVQRNDGGILALHKNTSILYREYHAAHLQRIFLRSVLLLRDRNSLLSKPPTPLERKREVACVGSFPLHHMLGDPHYARDIDLWVQSEAVAYKVWNLYHQIVISALGGSLTVLDGCTSAFGDNTIPGSRVNTSLYAIKAYWNIGSQLYLDSQLSPGCSLNTTDKALEDFFAEAKNNLPHSLIPRSYRISATWTLTSKAEHTYQSLRPINIIVLKDLGDFAYGDFSKMVSAGFDLKHCRLALQVEEDLRYSFHAEDDDRACAEQRKLVLLSSSFKECTEKRSVEKELGRLHKYFLRGFTF